MIKISKLRIGQPLYKFRSEDNMWRVEAVGFDWVVVRNCGSYEPLDVELLYISDLNYYFTDYKEDEYND